MSQGLTSAVAGTRPLQTPQGNTMGQRSRHLQEDTENVSEFSLIFMVSIEENSAKPAAVYM